MPAHDLLEIWLNNKPFSEIETSFRVQVGDIINIRQKNYRVESTKFALDYPDNYTLRSFRQSANCVEIKEGKKK